MLRFRLIALFAVPLLSFTGCKSTNTAAPVAESETRPYLKDSLIIYYDAQIGKAELLKKIAEYGAVAKYQYAIINAVAVTIPKNKRITDAEAYFKKVSGVLQVQKDYIQSAN